MSCQARTDAATLDVLAELISPYQCRATGGGIVCEPKTDTPTVELKMPCQGLGQSECVDTKLMGTSVCRWQG